MKDPSASFLCAHRSKCTMDQPVKGYLFSREGHEWSIGVWENPRSMASEAAERLEGQGCFSAKPSFEGARRMGARQDSEG